MISPALKTSSAPWTARRSNLLTLHRDHPVDAWENPYDGIAVHFYLRHRDDIARQYIHHDKRIDEVDMIDHHDSRTIQGHILNPFDMVDAGE